MVALGQESVLPLGFMVLPLFFFSIFREPTVERLHPCCSTCSELCGPVTGFSCLLSSLFTEQNRFFFPLQNTEGFTLLPQARGCAFLFAQAPPVSRWLPPSLQLINTTINPFQFPAPIADSISSGFSLHLLQEAHYLTQP